MYVTGSLALNTGLQDGYGEQILFSGTKDSFPFYFLKLEVSSYFLRISGLNNRLLDLAVFFFK